MDWQDQPLKQHILITFPVNELDPEIFYLRKRELGSPSHLLGAESCFHVLSSLAAQKLSNAAEFTVPGVEQAQLESWE